MRNTGVEKVLSNNCQFFAGRKSATKWALHQSIRFTVNTVSVTVHAFCMQSRWAKNQSLTTKSCTSGWTCRTLLQSSQLRKRKEELFDDARIYIFVAIYGVFPHIWVNRITAEWVSKWASEWQIVPLTICHPLHTYACNRMT